MAGRRCSEARQHAPSGVIKVRKSSLELLLWFWVTSHAAHAHLAGVSCCFHGWGACSTPEGMANCTKTVACNQWLITKRPLAQSSSGNEAAEVCGGNGIHGFGTKQEGKSSGIALPTWILLGLGWGFSPSECLQAGSRWVEELSPFSTQPFLVPKSCCPQACELP